MLKNMAFCHLQIKLEIKQLIKSLKYINQKKKKKQRKEKKFTFHQKKGNKLLLMTWDYFSTK